jgi:DNA-binding MarR family transcriptional regulator
VKEEERIIIVALGSKRGRQPTQRKKRKRKEVISGLPDTTSPRSSSLPQPQPEPIQPTARGLYYRFLLKRGNVGLARLLLAVYEAGPEGISTVQLLRQLGSTHNAQAFIKRAEREGLIERRKEGKSENGYFSRVYNILTERGRDLFTTESTATTTNNLLRRRK